MKVQRLLLTLSALCLLAGCGKTNVTSSKNESSTSQKAEDAEIREIYDLYREQGGTQSYEEWLASIKGEKG